ncbi:hypothetical protein A4X13_0g3972 [Tilletia indica]|uniref:Uncharacterized protein n=1 Tax=Tilletia indica TaxID=43049 RepID=A0A177TCW8_9BASI|nr:hypothetical protein A4X13_0g3972 [Tilletia indica]
MKNSKANTSTSKANGSDVKISKFNVPARRRDVQRSSNSNTFMSNVTARRDEVDRAFLFPPYFARADPNIFSLDDRAPVAILKTGSEPPN